MGVMPFLVASTVNVVISQRLVRKVCDVCRIQRALSIAEIKSLGSIAVNLSDDKIFTVGKGCDKCNGTGYRNRLGIHEVLEINDEVRELIVSRASANLIKQSAIKNGMTTMLQDGLQKAQQGVTTIEEVLRIIYE
jgi:type IV pilus assembly protein PilB